MEIVVRQISGLGNQMFQYAAGRYFARRYGASLRIAVDPAPEKSSRGYARPFLLSHFCTTAPMSTAPASERMLFARQPWLRPLAKGARLALGFQTFTEPIAQRYTFIEDLPLRAGARRLYLSGYWQAHGFVDHVAEEVRREFQLREQATGRDLEVLQKIGDSESVSLHIRRGDYTLAAEGEIALPMEYYGKAIAYLREVLTKPTFFVFSDEMDYARMHLPRATDLVFVDHNSSSAAHEDLRLMAACRHQIIANSTLSWWGAWLNPQRDKQVLAPRCWLRRKDSYYPDLLPSDWMLLDV